MTLKETLKLIRNFCSLLGRGAKKKQFLLKKTIFVEFARAGILRMCLTGECINNGNPCTCHLINSQELSPEEEEDYLQRGKFYNEKIEESEKLTQSIVKRKNSGDAGREDSDSDADSKRVKLRFMCHPILHAATTHAIARIATANSAIARAVLLPWDRLPICERVPNDAAVRTRGSSKTSHRTLRR